MIETHKIAIVFLDLEERILLTIFGWRQNEGFIENFWADKFPDWNSFLGDIPWAHIHYK